MSAPRPAFTAHDLRLLAGFLVLVELIVVYMLFVDGPLTRLGRLRQELATLDRGRQALLVAKGDRDRAHREQALPPPLARQPGESHGMAVRRQLEAWLLSDGLSARSVVIRPVEAPQPVWLAYEARAVIEGPYDATAAAIERLGAQRRLMIAEQIALRPLAQPPGHVQSELVLMFYFEAAPFAPMAP